MRFGRDISCRSQWPRGLRRSAAARLLRLWVRFPPGAWMFVCCECCVLSSTGHCVGLITRPQESSRVRCVWVWSWNPVMGGHDPESGRSVTGKFFCSDTKWTVGNRRKGLLEGKRDKGGRWLDLAVCSYSRWSLLKRVLKIRVFLLGHYDLFKRSQCLHCVLKFSATIWGKKQRTLLPILPASSSAWFNRRLS